MCQDDDATFTCVLFVQSGAPVSTAWLRNAGGFDTMRHTIVSNLTDNVMAPVYVSSTITVNSVTALDDGALYQCDLSSFITTNNATLTVVGKLINLIYFCDVHIHAIMLFNIYIPIKLRW